MADNITMNEELKNALSEAVRKIRLVPDTAFRDPESFPDGNVNAVAARSEPAHPERIQETVNARQRPLVRIVIKIIEHENTFRRVFAVNIDPFPFGLDHIFIGLEFVRLTEPEIKIHSGGRFAADPEISAGHFFQMFRQFLRGKPDDRFGFFRDHDPRFRLTVFSQHDLRGRYRGNDSDQQNDHPFFHLLNLLIAFSAVE